MTVTVRTQRTGRVGRPKLIDRRQVAQIAIDLFAREGYEAVTSQAIADAAGISQRTLFREFGTKSDLAWEGLRETADAMRDRAAPVAERRAPLAEMVNEIVLDTLRAVRDPEDIAFARRQLGVLGATPALAYNPILDEVRAVLSETFARSPTLAGRSPSLIADSLVSVVVAASLWWGRRSDETTLAQAVESALGGIGELASSLPVVVGACDTAVRSIRPVAP